MTENKNVHNGTSSVKLAGEMFLEVRIAKKTGNPYTVLVIKLENGFTKLVFLDTNEQFILDNY